MIGWPKVPTGHRSKQEAPTDDVKHIYIKTWNHFCPKHQQHHVENSATTVQFHTGLKIGNSPETPKKAENCNYKDFLITGSKNSQEATQHHISLHPLCLRMLTALINAWELTSFWIFFLKQGFILIISHDHISTDPYWCPLKETPPDLSSQGFKSLKIWFAWQLCPNSHILYDMLELLETADLVRWNTPCWRNSAPDQSWAPLTALWLGAGSSECSTFHELVRRSRNSF